MLLKLEKKVIVLTLICSGFFYSLSVLPRENVRADSAAAVINEIDWMGTTVSANNEWLELRNLTDADINLDGWKLVAVDGVPSMTLSGIIPASGYYLLERTDDNTVPGVTADLVYVGALSNSGEVLELKDAGGSIIDRVDASAGWLAGDNTTKQTMERKDEGSWQTSEAADGTPKAANTSPLPSPSTGERVCGNGTVETGDPSTGSGQEQCDDGNTVSGDGCDSSCHLETGGGSQTGQPTSLATSTGQIKYNLGDVVINEFVSDPADNEVEWIELYNTGSREIDLAGWTIEEGSGAKTDISGSVGFSGLSRFLVTAKPKGNLNNSGDLIILRDSTGVLIDQVAYGDWDDGNQSDNAPVASDPNSTARKIDGHNTYNNANDFMITTTPTKGSSNLISGVAASDEISAVDKSNYDYSDSIFVSELLPNPTGPDEQNEFIELYNAGDRAVNLTGWRLENSTGQKYQFKATSSTDRISIQPKEYLAFPRPQSKLVLHNSSDKILLYRPLEEKARQTIKYSEVKEGQSYNLVLASATSTDYSTWTWSEIPTPGQVNIIKNVNQSPVVDFTFSDNPSVGLPITFDSSDSYDPNGDKLNFSWEFGDGLKNNLAAPEHTYLKVGAYTVKLAVNDGQATTTKEKIIKVLDSTDVIVEAASCAGNYCASDVTLNELMPNPVGSDEEGEWVEIFNRGDVKINLRNWSLISGKSSHYKYIISDPTWLDLGQYLVLYRPDTNLVLNNTQDTVSLLDNSGQTIDQTTYASAKEGEAWARDKNNNWFWTIKPTPGEANIISDVVSAKAKSKSETAKSGSSTKSSVLVEITLDKVKDFAAGDQIKVKGTVAVLPGIFGTQYFYIVGSPGLQVYSYKKDFPDLRVGDYIEVTGELSLVNSEPRLKTKTSVDIKIVEHREPPKPEVLGCDDINEDMVGRLVNVNGELTECKSTQMIIDDGRDEAAVYLKKNAGISGTAFTVGQKVAVTGIVGKTTSGIKIMPRSIADIALASSSGQVLGESTNGDALLIEQRDKKIELFKYLFIILVAIIIVLAVLVVKYIQGNRKQKADPSASSGQGGSK